MFLLGSLQKIKAKFKGDTNYDTLDICSKTDLDTKGPSLGYSRLQAGKPVVFNDCFKKWYYLMHKTNQDKEKVVFFCLIRVQFKGMAQEILHLLLFSRN